ncbi:MAG: hypothetical protein KTR16_07000 [Acidiferrobacterales bacterium]|nr:hypothetical protein [Acidiferrobacterales bacterium]
MLATRKRLLAALLVFLLTVAYSVVISRQVSGGINLFDIGWQVIAQYSLASVFMLIVWRLMQAQAQPDDVSVILVLATAVLARIVLLLTDPYTSNDVDRYLFDGRVALEGLDPYRVSHNAPELADLRAAWAPPAEHAQYVTLYPPLALALFSIAAWFGAELAPAIWQLMTTIASLSILALGYAVLKYEERLKHIALLALFPLLILEAGEGLHLDVFSALAVMAMVCAWQRQRLLLMAICAGLGALIKILPALAMLPMVLLLPTWWMRIKLSALATGTWLLGYGIAFAIGLQPIGSIAVFFNKWRSGSPVFAWLEPWFSGDALAIFLFAVLILGLLAIVAAAYRLHACSTDVAAPKAQPYFLMQLAMAIPLLITPVIFPWYILPLVVLIALRYSAFILLWAIGLPLLYEVLNQFLCCQYWAPANWPIHTIGALLLVGVTWDIYKHKLRAAIATTEAKRVIYAP